jgi:thymidylate kinase
MIVQIRGTSGSGKTTVMRKVLERLNVCGHMTLNRRHPLYYHQHWPTVVSILGSYENTCGGCDTIKGYDALMSLARERADAGHVLMEGLLLSEDTKQTLLHLASRDLRVIFLNTPIETCLERVRGRREAKGNDKPLDPTLTVNRVRTIERARVKLEEAGVYCRTLSGNQAPAVILNWIKK